MASTGSMSDYRYRIVKKLFRVWRTYWEKIGTFKQDDKAGEIEPKGGRDHNV
jgi:hypothetical protein